MLIIRTEQKKAFREPLRRQRLRLMAEDLKRDFADELADTSVEDLLRQIENVVQGMEQYGFSRGENLYQLAAWGVFYGPGYETWMADGKLLSICSLHCPEQEKFGLFADCITSLEDTEDANASPLERQT